MATVFSGRGRFATWQICHYPDGLRAGCRKAQMRVSFVPGGRRLPRQGQDYERLVQWIQQCLHTRAEVIPNAILPDLITGERREIDVAIWLRDGPSKLLIMVEVRDRAGPQDVRWIEEVKSKRESVGAHAAYVISAGGLTGPALTKAQHFGIRAFSYDEAIVEPWGRSLRIRHVDTEWETAEVDMVLRDSAGRRLNVRPIHLDTSQLQPGTSLLDAQPNHPAMAATRELVRRARRKVRAPLKQADAPVTVKAHVDLDPPVEVDLATGDQALASAASGHVTFRVVPLQLRLVHYAYRDDRGEVHAEILEGIIPLKSGWFRLHLLVPSRADGKPIPAGTPVSGKLDALNEAGVALLAANEIVTETIVTGHHPDGSAIVTLKVSLVVFLAACGQHGDCAAGCRTARKVARRGALARRPAGGASRQWLSAATRSPALFRSPRAPKQGRRAPAGRAVPRRRRGANPPALGEADIVQEMALDLE